MQCVEVMCCVVHGLGLALAHAVDASWWGAVSGFESPEYVPGTIPASFVSGDYGSFGGRPEGD